MSERKLTDGECVCTVHILKHSVYVFVSEVKRAVFCLGVAVDT